MKKCHTYRPEKFHPALSAAGEKFFRTFPCKNAWEQFGCEGQFQRYFFTTGKKWFREKYDEIRQNLPIYPGRKFTSDQHFTFKILK
jgi:hypothetical protein